MIKKSTCRYENNIFNSENNEKHNIPIIIIFQYSIYFTSHIKFYYIFIKYYKIILMFNFNINKRVKQFKLEKYIINMCTFLKLKVKYN